MQLQIHLIENCVESQVNLDSKREHFSNKCKQLFSMLMDGRELTVLECANMGISSAPRRVKDLRENGVKISDRWENGVKKYFMNELDRQHNASI